MSRVTGIDIFAGNIGCRISSTDSVAGILLMDILVQVPIELVFVLQILVQLIQLLVYWW